MRKVFWTGQKMSWTVHHTRPTGVPRPACWPCRHQIANCETRSFALPSTAETPGRPPRPHFRARPPVLPPYETFSLPPPRLRGNGPLRIIPGDGVTPSELCPFFATQQERPAQTQPQEGDAESPRNLREGSGAHIQIGGRIQPGCDIDSIRNADGMKS